MRKNSILFSKTWLVSLLVIGFITSCSTSNSNTDIHDLREKTTPYMIVQSSAVVYMTMDEITDKSDVIIIGEPTKKDGIFNTDRDTKDPSKPDPQYFGIGQVYEVEVGDYLKGEGPNTIKIVEYQGHITQNPQELTENDIKQAMQRENIMPLSIGLRYIMFLRSFTDNYVDFPYQHYSGIGHPWRFEITDSNCVQPDDEITELSIYFPPTSLDIFIQYINNPATFPEVPYPAPLSPGRCPISKFDTTPYP